MPTSAHGLGIALGFQVSNKILANYLYPVAVTHCLESARQLHFHFCSDMTN